MKKRKLKKKFTVTIYIFLTLIIVGGIYMFIREINYTDHTTVKEKKSNKDSKEVKANKDLEKAPSNYEEFIKLDDGKYLTEKGFTLTIKDGIAYIDDNIIVNKTYSVPEEFKPVNPGEEVTGERCNNCIDKTVMDAFKLMQSDATSLGLNIYISSGYRSYSYQEKLYNNYTAVSGASGADTYSARAGHSEHQTGYCFDLNTIDDSFANTDEGKWVYDNAYLYGFVIRYPKGKENVTGYRYESWHLRYVGKSLAKELYNNGDYITLEEYYGITSSYG